MYNCTLYTITTWGLKLFYNDRAKERSNLIYFLYIPIPHWPQDSPRVWALDASVRGSYPRVSIFFPVWALFVLYVLYVLQAVEYAPRLEAAAQRNWT